MTDTTGLKRALASPSTCPEFRRLIAEILARVERQLAREVGATPTPDGADILNSLDGVIWLAVKGEKHYFFSHREDTLGWQPRGFIQDQVCLDAKFRNVGGVPVGPLVLPEAVRKVVG